MAERARVAEDRGAATVTAAAGRRRSATGDEQERRMKWGKQWGQVTSAAGKQARDNREHTE